jgi:hypothetical protein
VQTRGRVRSSLYSELFRLKVRSDRRCTSWVLEFKWRSPSCEVEPPPPVISAPYVLSIVRCFKGDCNPPHAGQDFPGAARSLLSFPRVPRRRISAACYLDPAVFAPSQNPPFSIMNTTGMRTAILDDSYPGIVYDHVWRPGGNPERELNSTTRTSIVDGENFSITFTGNLIAFSIIYR